MLLIREVNVKWEKGEDLMGAYLLEILRERGKRDRTIGAGTWHLQEALLHVTPQKGQSMTEKTPSRATSSAFKSKKV